MEGFRRGVRLGVDVGTARIGVARSDPDGMIATPVETVQRRGGAGPAVDRLLEIVHEHDAVALVVGLPLSLSGAETRSTEDSRAVAQLLAERGLEVRLVDERLTTVTAQAALHRSGRSTKGSRAVIDQVAAVVLLQHAIDVERRSGAPVGILVTAADPA